jgi:transposase
MHIRLPTREEIHTAFVQGEAAVVELILDLGPQVEGLARQLETQAMALKEWQAQWSKNSQNSSKPPSSEGYGKPKRTESLRKPGQKPNGGQPGPQGQTLTRCEHPDRIEIYTVESCQQGGFSLGRGEVTAHEERPVFDLPAIPIEVTAPRIAIKRCPRWGAENRGLFPHGGSGPVQYGPGVTTWAVYFQTQHVVPVDRTAQIFEDRLHHRIAEGTLIKAGPDFVAEIEPATGAVKEPLRPAAVLHADESGMRANGKLHGLQVVATDRLTDDTVHAQRGQTALEDARILPDFKGWVMHDHWKPYFGEVDCSPALCNAHPLRELQCIEKQ